MRGTLAERYWAKVDRRGPDDDWPWTAALNSAGYGVIRDDGGAAGRLLLAHRVALILDGRDPGPLEGLHSCDMPSCQNPAHLRPGTHAENLAEMVARGRHVPTAKLTPALVTEIRELVAGGARQCEVAIRFGVSRPTVSEIVNRRSWQRAA